MNTVPFGPRPPQDPLLAKAAELPKDVAPPHDLWPGIAARIAEGQQAPAKPAFRWPLALAAGLAIASLSALLTWGLMRDPGPAQPVASAQPATSGVMPVSYGPNSGLTEKELAVRDELFAQFQDAFERLRPETREAIVKNMAVMQEAADEIDAVAVANGLLH